MDQIPPAPEVSPLVRYGFAAIFTMACLYRLELGVRVAGVFMLGSSFYQGLLGRVPLIGNFSWKTKGYLKGPAATALIVAMIFISAVFIFAPDLVIRLVAMAHAADALNTP